MTEQALINLVRSTAQLYSEKLGNDSFNTALNDKMTREEAKKIVNDLIKDFEEIEKML